MAAISRAAVHVGCSGWHYAAWRGRIYPRELPASRWLEAYARRFDVVEINNSFYRLPSRGTFAAWAEAVPRRFRFAVKASRYLTHMKRLTEARPALARLLEAATPLGPHLGPLLYQLPPRWVPDPVRLETFLSGLPRQGPGRRRLRHVIEFRDPRGYEPGVLARLARHRVTLCVHDMPGAVAPRVARRPLAYVRFHGYGARYGGSYPDRVLRDWAGWIRDRSRAGVGVLAFFNNDIDGHAVRNADRLRELI